MKVNLTIGIPIWLDRVCVWPVMIYRKLKYGYTFRRIDLGEGEWAIVDWDVYYRISKYKWHAMGKRGLFYAVRKVKISPTEITTRSMHREIMNAPDDLLVDHQNRNKLDNRIANLRLATHSENMWNRRRNKTKASSKYIGVSFNKRSKRWCCRIGNDGNSIWLGTFDNEMEAARAYDEAARKYHREFAQLNFSEKASNTLPAQ
jgi:hypothetical protein